MMTNTVTIKDPYVGTPYETPVMKNDNDVDFMDSMIGKLSDTYPWKPGMHTMTFSTTWGMTAQAHYQDFLDAMAYRKNFAMISVNVIPGFRSDSIMVTFKHDGPWGELPEKVTASLYED